MTAELAQVADRIPRARMSGVIARLRRGQSLRLATISEGMDDADRRVLLRLADDVQDCATPEFLGSVIEALYLRRDKASMEPAVVWTGPVLQKSVFSPTLLATRDVVRSASRRLLIAGYRITADALGAIGVWDAGSKSVSVDLVANERDVSESDLQIMIAKGVNVRMVRSAENALAKFHVKAIVADGLTALVGSANFTSYGQNNNVELGLIVSGSTASRIEGLLDEYMALAESAGWVLSR